MATANSNSNYASFAFRYTLEEDPARLDEVRAWVQREATGYVVIQHDADAEVQATHWHGMLRSSKKLEALRLSFKRALPGIEKTMYSMKTCTDEDVYERYMCHGQAKGDSVKIVISQGLRYTPEWAQAQNAAFWDAQAKFKENIKKKNKQSTIDELLDECKTSQVTTVRGVVVACVRMWKRQKRVVQETYMISVIKGVCLQLDLGAFNEQGLADRLENFLFS